MNDFMPGQVVQMNEAFFRKRMIAPADNVERIAAQSPRLELQEIRAGRSQHEIGLSLAQ